ncbi:helix-turn-helix domain-containing protein [Eggerthellaceae bacterium zg-893]|nr:helix-turn-helix domain-containing protein [Eggerthellaceae bacterium zg-893]
MSTRFIKNHCRFCTFPLIFAISGGHAMKTQLQRIRKERGFKSAKSFADYIGMNAHTYTDYEQGRRTFTLESAWEFADVLQCTLDELAGRDFDYERYADQRQAAMNDDYAALTDAGKDAAFGAVHGIRAAEKMRGLEEKNGSAQERAAPESVA